MSTETSTSHFVATTVGSMNFHVLREIIDEFDIVQLNRGVEVGVLQGDTSVHLLTAFPSLTLFGVDPYAEYSEVQGERTLQAMSVYEAVARSRFSAFEGRGILIKKPSLEAAQEIPDRSLDFVFIDALHQYTAVRDDIAAWLPKLRPGGLIAGHDLSWEGVRRAVGEFAISMGIGINYTPLASDIWFTFTPSDQPPLPRSTVSREMGFREVAKRYGVPLP